jgi:hypothetical protein
MIPHYARFDEEKDWRTRATFETIPPDEEGFMKTRTVTAKWLSRANRRPLAEGRTPKPGDEYGLTICHYKREQLTEWWN